MKHFIKKYTDKKVKWIILFFIIISLSLGTFISYDLVYYKLPYTYLLLSIPWFILSLFFIKDKSVIWNEENWKIVLKRRIATFLLLIFIFWIRIILIKQLRDKFNLLYVLDGTLLISLWFYLGRLFFILNKINFIFLNIHSTKK